MSELFIEIGCEELPARFIGPALQGFAVAVERLLGDITHGTVRTFGTPRRLAVSVEDVAPTRPVVEKLITGPSAASAWTELGPGPAAIAFARGKGVDPSALELVEGPKGRLVALRRVEGGERTADVVAAGLEAAVLTIPFKKTMRWGTETTRFARPLHRVLCVYAGQVVDTRVMGLVTTGTTSGHWLHHPEPVAVTGWVAYLVELRQRLVLADPAERKSLIRRQLETAAEAEGCAPPLDEALLEEVTNLVEWPSVVVGRFPVSLLELPPRLLVESMKVNQRYFPLFRGDTLTNTFLVVTNNPSADPELVAVGNARVLTARFYDAKFFYAEDRKKALAVHGERLAGMTWIRGLGTMADRQARITRIAADIAPLLGADVAVAEAAGGVCKADLATQMVGEFPELQGHVGRLLAEAEGLGADVAMAIEEHYLPRGQGDNLPRTPAGAALALADRLLLVGEAFARDGLGLVPKGNADPQGIRRAASGIVQILLDRAWQGSIARLFALAGFVDARHVAVGEFSGPDFAVFDHGALHEFVRARFRASMVAEGHAVDVVDAVMAAGGGEIVAMAGRIRAVSALFQAGGFEPVRTAFRRVAGLARDHALARYTPDLFQVDAERALDEAMRDQLGEDVAPDALLGRIVQLRPVVDHYFDVVHVMCDDPALRDNRLGLLRTIYERVSRFADFSRLSAGGTAGATTSGTAGGGPASS